jgi:2,3-diphosphopglycerate-independent phosphoglycerate mutase
VGGARSPGGGPARGHDLLTPIVLVLLDGLGDRAHPSLGGQTASEAAPTPNLDGFVARASNGLVWPLGPGRAPSSELAHWTYFTGSLQGFPGRAVLEGLGHGVAFEPGEVVGFAALRGATRDDDGRVWLGARACGADSDDGWLLLAAIDGQEVGGLRFELHPVAPGEAILRLQGDADTAVSDTDAFEDDLHPLLACQPLAARATAAVTAAAVNSWTRASARLLATHPVNGRREQAGRPPLTVVTTKWWGCARPVASFPERTGLRGAVVSDAAYQAGIAAALGLSYHQPPTPGPDEHSVAARVRLARRLLQDGVRLRPLPRQVRRRGRAHEGPGAEAGCDRGARRRARGPRVAGGRGGHADRRPRHPRQRADASFGRSCASCPRRAQGRPGRRGAVRRAAPGSRVAGPGPRGGPSAARPQRRRPGQVPWRQVGAVPRRRWRRSRAAATPPLIWVRAFRDEVAG